MQALEILNKLKNKMLNFTSIDVENATIEIEAMQEHNRELFLKIIELTKQIDEAIANFETTDVNRRECYQKGFNEAMKPKTCEGCKQSWKPNNQTFHKYFCEYLKIPVHGGFYCNRYQQKDNQ